MKNVAVPARLSFAAFLFLAAVVPHAPAGEEVRRGVKPPPLTETDRLRLRHLTLDEAIDLAVRRNPNVLQALQQIQSAKGAYLTARAGALPQLTFSGNYSKTDKGLSESLSRSSQNGTLNPDPLGGQLFDSAGNRITGRDVNGNPTPFNLNTALTQSLFGSTTSGGGAIGNGAASSAGALSSLSGSSGSGSSTQSYQIQLQVTQNVYTGGRVSAQTRAAQLTEGNAYHNLREVIEQTILNVRTGFYQVLLGRELIRVQEESIRLLESQLRDQQNRFAAGTVPRFNVLQAQVQLANQQPQLINANNQFAIGKLQLARLIGVDTPPQGGRIADFELVGELAYEPREFNAEKAVAAALNNRSILKQRRQEVGVQQEQIRVALAGYHPQVQADIGVLQRNSRVETLGDPVNGWFAGATVTWNIFDGLSAYGQYKQARASRNNAMISYDDAVRQITDDVQNAILSLRQAKQTVSSQVVNVSTAEESVRLAQARLGAGAGTQLDVLNAQVQLTSAQSTLVQAKYNYNVAIATIDQSTGTSTVYQDNVTDPVTRAGFAPIPASNRGTPHTVTRGETRHSINGGQSVARRAEGVPEKPKIDAERVGIPRPELANPVNAPKPRTFPSALPTETLNPLIGP